jgi:hypothetical protein
LITRQAGNGDRSINVQQRELLQVSAIVIQAGEDKETRWLSGSYQEAATPLNPESSDCSLRANPRK